MGYLSVPFWPLEPSYGLLPPLQNMADNQLYFGDNLDVLRRHIPDESVDLIYLDPPFQSGQSYNVLFEERDGSRSAAQIQAFEDTWGWDLGSRKAYEGVVEEGGPVSRAMQAFMTFLGESDMLAYLSMMAPRLKELHRVLKSTGSLYLHCDPTASHYLKMLLDAVFGPERFRSEIVWKRTYAHSDTKQGRKIHGHIHDIIFFYTKGDEWTWNPVYQPYDQEYIESMYRHVEEETGRRYQDDNLTAARPGGDTEYEWRVKRKKEEGAEWEADLDDEWKDPKPGWEYKGVPPYSGRYWAYSKEKMEEFARNGRLHHRSTGMPRYKRYLDEMPGVPLQDLWTEINPISAKAAERLGYPTQKPEALMERIIESSSDEGDVVLDPFCGCGTTVSVAHRMDRKWVGIDITHLAINLVKHRLQNTFGEEVKEDYEVHGEPTTVREAEELAKLDRFEFENWALGLVGARKSEPERGADKGIDGRLYFHYGNEKDTKQIILSVKSGKTGPKHVRDLRGVVDREEAEIGVLISLRDPTPKMEEEATSAGFYESPWGKHPRIQILTIEELLDGKTIDRPRITGAESTFKAAPRAAPGPVSEQATLELDEEGG